MRTRCPLVPLFSIVLTLPSLIMLIGERTVSEAAQLRDQKNFTEFYRSAQDVLTELGIISVLNKVDVEQATDRGLEILQELIAGTDRQAQEFRDLGFETDKVTIEDIPNAFPVFEVRLNDLRTYSPGRNLKTLLFYTNQLLLPLRADKQVQSSLTIRLALNRQDEVNQKRAEITWRPTRWGQPNLIRQLTKVQAQLETQNPNFKLGFLVSIPSLNRNFLGYKDNVGIKFVPLVTNRHVKDPFFREGESLSAEEAFQRLSEEARSVDDKLPR